MKQRVEAVEFQGVRYRRYPDSRRLSDANYFKSSTGTSLHRAVWAFHNGPIPPGHHVHHVDGNTGNNDISNLECVPAAVHLREHMLTPERLAKSRAAIELARPAAAEWHRSEAGKAFHSKLGRASWDGRVGAERECVVCGGKFHSRTGRATVCSNRCFAAQRRSSGVDDADFTCPECGATFRANKYSKQVMCSRSCATKKNNRDRREARAS